MAAGGAVEDDGGQPVPGVTVTLTGPGGVNRQTITDADGNYLFDDIPVGNGYLVTATPPDGTSVSGPRPFDVPPDTEEPVTGLDFVVTADPTGSAAGRVIDEDGSPLSGVVVVVTGPDVEYRVSTDAESNWFLDGLPPGDYTATVIVPDGADVVGSDEREFTIPADGGSETGLDFVIDFPEPETFSASGRVVDEGGDAVAGVDVILADPNTGDELDPVETDTNGIWTVDGLAPGSGWTAALEEPAGYQPVDPLTFDIDDEDATGLNFVLTPTVSTPSPSPTPTSSPTPTPTSAPTSAPTTSAPAPPVAGPPLASENLAATGGPGLVLLVGGLLLLLAGTVLTVTTNLSPAALAGPRRREPSRCEATRPDLLVGWQRVAAIGAEIRQHAAAELMKLSAARVLEFSSRRLTSR